MIKSIQGQLRDTIAQKLGVLLILVADTVAAAWMGTEALGGLGLAVLVLSLVAIVADPWASTARSEGAAALLGDPARAARLFVLSAMSPLGWLALIAAALWVVGGGAEAVMGAEAAGYLAPAIAAHAVGEVALAGVSALRKSGRPGDCIASTWTLTVVNCVGNTLAIHYGLGAWGLGVATLAAELAALGIPLVRAHRHGLLAWPHLADAQHVARLSWRKHVSLLPATADRVFRAAVLATIAPAELALYTLLNNVYKTSDQLSAELTKVGVAAIQRGGEGAEEDAMVATRWGVVVRLLALPAAAYYGGWLGALLVVAGHFGLMSYAELTGRLRHTDQAVAGGAEQVTRVGLLGMIVLHHTPTAAELVAIWLTGIVVYCLTERARR
jgi:hypothetical protein